MNISVAGSCDSSPLLLSVKRLFFDLEPVIKLGAGLIAVLYIEFVSAAVDAFFERKVLDRGPRCACGACVGSPQR
jgi:hypothetical protein